MLQEIRTNYDEKFDVLYARFADVGSSYGDDETPGLIYTRDVESDKVMGITIYGFLKKYKSKKLPVLTDEIPVTYDELYMLVFP